jgi:hypothetical protein
MFTVMGELYCSKEWKSLEEVDRAQLLLVIEGLKRGTIIRGNWTSFMEILKKTGLSYELNSSKYCLDPVVIVAKQADLRQADHQFLTLPEKIIGGEHHKISGWLLSYPPCCIDEYVKERTPEQRSAKKIGRHHLSYRFGQELDYYIKVYKTYPEFFDYRPPSFTPCGIECEESARVLTSWKEAIDSLDPNAGKELIYFNRNSFPERLAHKEYLKEEAKRRSLEFRIKILRSYVK